MTEKTLSFAKLRICLEYTKLPAYFLIKVKLKKPFIPPPSKTTAMHTMSSAYLSYIPCIDTKLSCCRLT